MTNGSINRLQTAPLNKYKSSADYDTKHTEILQTHSEIIPLRKELDSKMKQLMDDENNIHSDYKDKYEKLKSDRAKVVKKVDKNQLSLYSKMLGANGHGMVSIVSESCGNCFTVLPTQLVTEVKQNIDFKNCPSCNILLYYEQQ